MSSGEQFRESDGIQHELVGNSAAIVALAHRIARIAPAKLPVLIQGESGTGKELVARAVHANSPYSNGPFVAVNSAALSENLAKSELFGHERGSFTGAVAQQKGCFELANNGTLFLDEIGELNPSVQAMLLRVLQTCEFQRLGATHTIHVNVRLIAATNCDLRVSVDQGTFREDLYFRLKVLWMRTPALRERREDIPILARHFASGYAKENGLSQPVISSEVDAALQQYDWPGNVRELQHTMQQAVVLRSADMIRLQDLPEEIVASTPKQSRMKLRPLKEVMWEKKREYVAYVVKLVEGDYKLASNLLGIPAKGFHSLLRRLNLRHLL